MGKPKTLLEGLCGHALSLGADSISVEYRDGREWVLAQRGGAGMKIAAYPGTGADAGNYVRTSTPPLGEDAFEVRIEPAPERDSSVPPSFTPKQGQYLAYIHYYSKIHRQAPSESDLQLYFRVSPPSTHQMIVTLERNGLIARTAGQARSIRLLVRPEHLSALD